MATQLTEEAEMDVCFLPFEVSVKFIIRIIPIFIHIQTMLYCSLLGSNKFVSLFNVQLNVKSLINGHL